MLCCKTAIGGETKMVALAHARDVSLLFVNDRTYDIMANRLCNFAFLYARYISCAGRKAHYENPRKLSHTRVLGIPKVYTCELQFQVGKDKFLRKNGLVWPFSALILFGLLRLLQCLRKLMGSECAGA